LFENAGTNKLILKMDDVFVLTFTNKEILAQQIKFDSN